MMNNIHRYFVQYMMRNGVSSVENAITFCKNVSKGEPDKIQTLTDVKTLIRVINSEIGKQSFKIVITTCEVTCKDMFIWLNTKNDEISRLQNIYTALELEYFHAILQEILSSEEHKVTFIVCINISSTLTGAFSRDSGQEVLNKWLKNGYFVKKDSYIHLGKRLILEFTSYLKSHCPNGVCNLCSELVFSGKQCQSCDKTFHSYCLSKFLANQKTCPSCHRLWIGTVEMENTRNYDEDEESSQSPVTERDTVNHNSANESDEEPQEAGPSRRRKKRRS